MHAGQAHNMLNQQQGMQQTSYAQQGSSVDQQGGIGRTRIIGTQSPDSIFIEDTRGFKKEIFFSEHCVRNRLKEHKLQHFY